MSYKVNEIFYSLQAEGAYTGTPAVFIRLSGCNLSCPWCDTKNHWHGENLTKKQIEKKVFNLIGDNKKIIIVFTGGEPTLQLKENEELLRGYRKHIETNGINEIPSWIDYVTVSPKTDVNFFEWIRKPDEIKIVYDGKREFYIDSLIELKRFHGVKLYIQPLEESGKMNIDETVDFIKKNPDFKLSLQFHKLVGIR